LIQIDSGDLILQDESSDAQTEYIPEESSEENGSTNSEDYDVTRKKFAVARL